MIRRGDDVAAGRLMSRPRSAGLSGQLGCWRSLEGIEFVGDQEKLIVDLVTIWRDARYNSDDSSPRDCDFRGSDATARTRRICSLGKVARLPARSGLTVKI